MKCVVLGGAGAMGRIIVKDLMETAPEWDKIVIADYDFSKARALAASFESARIGAVRLDVRERARTVQALEGAFVVINSVQYQYNLDAMEAALAAYAHYVDLGGLFHMTRKQLELHERFHRIDRTALIGMGAAPGITNILARYAAERLDAVREIHTRVASIDRTRYEPKPALAASYSLKTILEEFSLEPAVFTKGEFKFVKPMSGGVPHRFPAPIGVQRPMYMIHSEVATLPLSYKDKGIKEVSFKMAFDPEFTDRVRFLRDLGLGSNELMDVEGAQVRPVDVMNKVATSQPAPRQIGKWKQYEIVRAVVKGAAEGKKVTWVLDCHTKGMPDWGLGADIDTGSPPSIAAHMLARGIITERGVVPPEMAVPPEPFFKELKRRKMTVKARRKSGWAYPV